MVENEHSTLSGLIRLVKGGRTSRPCTLFGVAKVFIFQSAALHSK